MNLENIKQNFVDLPFLNRKYLIRFSVLFLLLVVSITISIYFDVATLKDYLETNPGQTVLISLATYILFGLTFLPTFPLTVFLAILLGPFQAAIIATLGNTIAAFLGYTIGKSMGDIINFEQKKSRLPFGLGKIPIKSPLFMLVARLLPAGSRAYSMVCGAYQVPIPLYLWTTTLMFFVNSAFLAFGGLTLIQLR
jgi:uncharacterized membrane protein YdjX (TVP38/TMEM64 family)